VYSPCDNTWITQLSIGNKSTQDTLVHWQDILNLVSVVLLIGLY
jgi:hypothetical protein